MVTQRFFQSGVMAALGAALLFGIGTPLAKLLLGSINPWMLAGLLYLGSGTGLFLYRYVRRSASVALARSDIPWFVSAIVAGGIIGPVLLMLGLSGMSASGASLLLNAEGVFTTALAWFVFKENLDRRIAFGMFAIIAGALILSWPDDLRMENIWPSLSILGACLAWGIDNNLTRKVSLSDASWIASVKGLVAGSVNLFLAFMSGAAIPPMPDLIAATLLGFFAYGVSLSLFVIGLRHLGTARTGAYFSLAPFLGATLAVLLGEPLSLSLIFAGLLMALGIYLHLTEHHHHLHTHEELEHGHEHVHDKHHQHAHEFPVETGVKHSHPHKHSQLTHGHAHFPDAHHQHKH
ncbi:EamA family transporter [Undibacterium sp. Jales W-56]|uniref:DMT family transporter n=1 Tax=Undibacterium sp. Jales W-56 TaxID=2897325 RepID=UPI0021D01B66|nr:DMT family transporter [Undibacterium sp. Jales W-56]MCU6433859.1 EamA family transporter [Undibacterium sp. Jales W-56]